MKKIVKFLSMVLMIAFLSIIMVGCSKKTESNPNAIKITAVRLGYGLDWLYAIRDAYEEKTGNSVEIEEVIGQSGSSSIQTEIESHSSDTDIFFNHFSNFYKTIYQGSVSSNGVLYDCEFADLSDLYTKALDGENGATIKSKMNADYEEYYNYNGKYYGLPWAYGAMGIVRNKDVWDKLGLTDDDVPNTTEELFTLCDKIIEKASESSETSKIAPFIYSLEDEYYSSLMPLFAYQYEGTTGAEYMMEGKDPVGEYSQNMFSFDGEKYAIETIERLLDSDNGYQHKSSQSLSFTNMQGYFLSGQAVFCVNGTWLEIEMGSNYKNANIDFIKTPVISELSEKLSYYTGNKEEDDAKLSELIDYVDTHSDNSSKPSYATDEDIEIVREARSFSYTSSGAEHIAVIPAYSDKIEEAKDFLAFMYSDEGLNIYYKTMNGAMLPLTPTNGYTENIEYSTFRTSINNLLNEGQVAMYLYADKAKIYSLGGVSVYYTNGLSQSVTQALLSKMTSDEIIAKNAKYVQSNWTTISKYID